MPGPPQSLIAFWNSGRQSVDSSFEGLYLSNAFNAGMAMKDVIPAEALAGSACQVLGIAGWKMACFADSTSEAFKFMPNKCLS